jgi:hypothetical protein
MRRERPLERSGEGRTSLRGGIPGLSARSPLTHATGACPKRTGFQRDSGKGPLVDEGW